MQIVSQLGFNGVYGEGEWVVISSIIMESILHNLSPKKCGRWKIRKHSMDSWEQLKIYSVRNNIVDCKGGNWRVWT